MNRNITAAILIVLAIGIYFTVTESILADAGKVQQVNAQYVDAINTANRLLALRDQVVSDYNALLPADKERLSKMVPSSVDNIRLIIDLNNVAAKHGMSLQNIKAIAPSVSATGQTTPLIAPGTSQSGGMAAISIPTLDSVTISFSVTAPYLQFVSFMQDLEANLRIMDVTHLSMTASETGIYTFQVEMKTYWLRQH